MDRSATVFLFYPTYIWTGLQGGAKSKARHQRIYIALIQGGPIKSRPRLNYHEIVLKTRQ